MFFRPRTTGSAFTCALGSWQQANGATLAGKLAQDTIEEVQRANDIVEVISSYVPLKRAGKDYKACCPLHQEKTPSFYVSPAKQIFKCFGCGRGGSVFQFVMARENVTFPEAVRLLADRAGIRIPEARDRGTTPQGPDRSRVIKTLAWATQVYQRLLRESPAGEAALAYLRSRGFTDETIEAFRLGVAPDSWDALLRSARKRGVPDALLLAAGLVVTRSDGSGVYDRFRNRVMFPIFDTLNRPVGFGGRAMGDDPAKYLNSPDTVVFDKSRLMYGLLEARDAMTAERRAIVVEGYTDCIMAHQAGLKNVVATLGTSLTRDHVRLLKRYADEVVLVFDGDLAGQNAADRALALFLEEELTVRIATLPEGIDPCDHLAEGHREDFEALLATAPDALEHKWRLVRQQFDASGSIRGQRRAVEAMLEALAAQPAWSQSQDSLKRDLLLARMASTLGIEERSLRERLSRLVRQARTRVRYDDRDAAEDRRRRADESERHEQPELRIDGLRHRAERLVLEVLLGAPEKIRATSERFPPARVQTDSHRRLYEALIEYEELLQTDGVSVLWSHLEDERLVELAAGLSAGSTPAAETAGLESGEDSGDDPVDEKTEALLSDALATLGRLDARDELAAVRERLSGSMSEEDRRAALERFQELRKESRGFLPPGMRAGSA